MAMLTENPDSSQPYPNSVQMPDQLLQEQMEIQISSRRSQMNDVKSALVVLRSQLTKNQQMHKAKISTLEEVLDQAHIQTEQARRERDLSRHKAKEKDVQICLIMADLCQIAQEMKHHLLEKDSDQCFTIQQLGHEQEHLSYGKQQLQSLVWSLREGWQKYRDSQMLAAADVLEGQSELPHFCPDAEQTRNQAKKSHDQSSGEAEDPDGVQDLLLNAELTQQNQENIQRSDELHMEAQEYLQVERPSLVQQLVSFKLDNQLLQAALKEAELQLSSVKKEKTQLQRTLSETNLSLQKLTLEKQQVTYDLDMQHVKLVQLQGLKVAQGMQQELTAKREQVDLLQSRMQMLEDVMEKFAQEKDHHGMENKSQEQVLLFERESRRRLEKELENVRASEKHLKNKVKRLDATLHKMSDSFAECQEFIQKQEQEIVQLKLQHALEVKELQGQNLWSTGKVCKPNTSSTTLPAKPTISQINLSSPKKGVNPVLKLQNLVKELHDVSEEKETITYTNLSHRKSKKTHNTRNEQGFLQTTHLRKWDTNVALSPDCEELRSREGQDLSVSPCMAALGRKSPVHFLLTSDLCSDLHSQETETSESNGQTLNPKENELSGPTHKDLQGKLKSLQNQVENLQIKNQEMSSMLKHQERRKRQVQIRREPQKR